MPFAQATRHRDFILGRIREFPAGKSRATCSRTGRVCPHLHRSAYPSRRRLGRQARGNHPESGNRSQSQRQYAQATVFEAGGPCRVAGIRCTRRNVLIASGVSMDAGAWSHSVGWCRTALRFTASRRGHSGDRRRLRPVGTPLESRARFTVEQFRVGDSGCARCGWSSVVLGHASIVRPESSPR